MTFTGPRVMRWGQLRSSLPLVVKNSGAHLYVRPLQLSGDRGYLAKAIGNLADSHIELIKGPANKDGREQVRWRA